MLGRRGFVADPTRNDNLDDSGSEHGGASKIRIDRVHVSRAGNGKHSKDAEPQREKPKTTLRLRVDVSSRHCRNTTRATRTGRSDHPMHGFRERRKDVLWKYLGSSGCR